MLACVLHATTSGTVFLSRSSKSCKLNASPAPVARMTAELAKEFLRYEKGRFASWCATVDAAVTAGLQQPLLSRQALSADTPLYSSGDASMDAASLQKAQGSMGSAATHRVVINFPSALLRLVREAKYLDQLGFAVPQLAVNLALQEWQIRCEEREGASMIQEVQGVEARNLTEEGEETCCGQSVCLL